MKIKASLDAYLLYKTFVQKWITIPCDDVTSLRLLANKVNRQLKSLLFLPPQNF